MNQREKNRESDRMKKPEMILFAAALVLTAASVTGCSGKGSTSASESSEIKKATAPTGEYEGVPDLDEGPLLTIKDTEAAAGEIAEVTVSVEFGDQSWSVCALHLSYPEKLECVKNDSGNVKMTLGEANSGADIHLASEWQGEVPEEVEEKGNRLVFFNTSFIEDNGGSGDIAALYFRLPDDAKSGDVYEIDFFDDGTNVFTDSECDKSIEKYAFSHCRGGKITVKP